MKEEKLMLKLWRFIVREIRFTLWKVERDRQHRREVPTMDRRMERRSERLGLGKREQ